MRLIDADAIVEIAENSYNTWNLAMAAAETNREINKVFKMQELCKAVKQVAECLPTIAPKPQWIPVSERLPEDAEMMLVTYRTNGGLLRVNQAYYNKGCWRMNGYNVYGVIAWMPMPESYDLEDAEQED